MTDDLLSAFDACLSDLQDGIGLEDILSRYPAALAAELRAELAARAQLMADTAAPAAEDARGLLPIGHNHGLHPQEFNE